MTTETAGPDPRSLDPATAMHIAELAEASMWWATVALSPRGVRRAMGIQAARIGSGVALATAHDPTAGYWSRAFAQGLTETVDDALVEELLGFYRAAGAPMATLAFAPTGLPDDWDDIAGRHGLEAGESVTKFMRHRRTPVAPAATDLEIRGVDARDSSRWAEVMMQGFGMPTQEDLVAMIASAVGRDFYASGAWDGDRLVMAASVFIGGDVASLAGAAPLPGSRGGEAHQALLALRVEEAIDAGCTWMVADARTDHGGDAAGAADRLRAAGFVDVYERRDWIWRAGA